MKRPTITLFADVLGGFGGIETYLDALARRLHADGWPVRVAVCLNGPAPFLDPLAALGIPVYRQRQVPGDRWQVRQRLLVRHVAGSLRPGDWVYCVRQPMPEIYLPLVRAVHGGGSKIGASWMYAPEYLPPAPGHLGQDFCQAVSETDAVISVAACTIDQFRTVYGHTGPVHVVRYHNRALFAAPVPIPAGPPFGIGFMGRIDIYHKNLDTILAAFAILAAQRTDVVLNMHGGGNDIERYQTMVADAGLTGRVVLHGRYDHARDLAKIVAANHVFVYTSRFEGGPCLSLIELLQAGRYVVASPVGGIPDIYEGRPDIGALVPSDDPRAIAAAFDNALLRANQGTIDPARIRALYEAEFHDDIAHRQWLNALSLSAPIKLRDSLCFEKKCGQFLVNLR